ncbi:MAG: hypothetical protein ABL957_16880 [Parvularculaceae bacterium]
MRAWVPLALATVSGAAVIGGVAWWAVASRNERPAAERTAVPAGSGVAVATPEASPAAAEVDPDEDAPPASPDALAEYERRLAIQGEMADFLQGADRMPTTERDRRVKDLAARIGELEQARIIVGAQGLYLRATLIRAQHPADAEARDAAMAALQAQYAGAIPSTAHLDEQYRGLKTREQEIVREANARAFFPNGMTREEYLRAELDKALREAYSADD